LAGGLDRAEEVLVARVDPEITKPAMLPILGNALTRNKQAPAV